ncbi:MAG: hypothetical protein ACK5PB_23635 [Pirellula sp.]|jgi:hypothetical protein
MRVWLTRFIACSVLSSPPLLAQESDTTRAENSTESPKSAMSPNEDCNCGGTDSTTTVSTSHDGTPEIKSSGSKETPPIAVNCLHLSSSAPQPNQGEWFLSDMLGSWLKSPVRFRTEVAVHFSNEKGASENRNVIATVCLENAEQDSKTADASNQVQSTNNHALNSKPLEFSTGFEKLVEEVIACGHRICTGNKCYEVKDEPVVGDDCSTSEMKVEEEPIMVVPAAPPAPPAMFFTENHESQPTQYSVVNETLLKELNINAPAQVIMNLLVDNARLSARLELTETLMAERQAAMEQIYSMAEKNARLQTQIAVNEARQHATEQLTASLMDRTEVAMKLVATRADSANESDEAGESNESTATLKAIQEDLSNIRKQIALMKRQTPVPFAPSSVGRPQVQPYVPSLKHYTPTDCAEPTIAKEPHGTSKY